jgi:Mn-dependent DtxR family transcriptional regulator
MSISKMSSKQSLKDTVFKEFLRNPTLGPSEMAEKLDAKYNSVKAAFAKLAEDGFLDRPSRGTYAPSIPGILLDLIERVEALEEAANR